VTDYERMKEAAKTLSDIFGIDIEARYRSTYEGPKDDKAQLYIDGMLILEKKLNP